MKTLFNLTTSEDDLSRFSSQEDLLAYMDGFDGLELMPLGEDGRGIVPKGRVIGLHMGFFPYWLDFWRGDEAVLMNEFGSIAECEQYYGGTDKNALLRRFREDLASAEKYGAEYVVFHVSDANIAESFTWRYRHSDEEVIDAACELLNGLFPKRGNGGAATPALLLENLWQPGLRFTRPEMTARLLDGVEYENKGIMLDTGHLLHTNTALRTEEEGLGYINHMLDEHGALTNSVRGVHLHQSLTGEYCEKMMKAPPALGETYAERYTAMFYHAFNTDRHLPFTCHGVDKLISRIAPEYLTFEFMSESREQHSEYLSAQRRALAGVPHALPASSKSSLLE